MTLPKFVKLVEVGPRDGLQNETQIIPADIKIDFINRLSETGLSAIEVGSFVSPKWIPQMADSQLVFQNINKKPQTHYSVLVPNLKGLERALSVDVKEIAVFAAATETFSQKNLNCSIEESLQQFSEVIQTAQKNKIKIRGYISCALGCPYEGKVDPTKVGDLAEKLYSLGCYEISLGDTIGVGTPSQAQKLIQIVSQKIPLANIGVHFHDTYGQALANIYAVLQQGIQIVDTSVAGLGGCPYAPGAAGNVASEDVLYLLNGLNIATEVNLEKLCEVGLFISNILQRPPRSKVTLALSQQKNLRLSE